MIDAFMKMKSEAIFLNLGRGPIVKEEDLAWALTNHEIAGAGLDVLSKEPIKEENPLYAIRENTNLFITPHIAWASLEARKRLMDCIYAHVEEFINKEEPL